MSITVCSSCGASYQGWQCPNCYAADKHREATEAASEQLVDTLDRNVELQQEAAERLAERIAEEQEATRRSQEEATYRMEMATAEAARQHTYAIAIRGSLRLEPRQSEHTNCIAPISIPKRSRLREAPYSRIPETSARIRPPHGPWKPRITRKKLGSSTRSSSAFSVRPTIARLAFLSRP